jgi:alpha-glucosidase
MRAWFLCCLLLAALRGLSEVSLLSPDGRLRFDLSATREGLFYEVSADGIPLILPSRLGLAFGESEWGQDLRISRIRRRHIERQYELPVGKARHVQERGEELGLTFAASAGWKIILRVRAYDDGIAFRYELLEQRGQPDYELKAERSSFRLAGDPAVSALLLPHFRTSHEGLYTHAPLSALPNDTLIDMPALFRCADSLWLAITEAALRDYAGMYLQKDSSGALFCRLSPLPDQPGIAVRASLPHRSPWRVMMIARQPGALIESNLLTHLNEPCDYDDLSWLRPGKSTWTWWNGDIIKDAAFPVGQNFATHQYYIDFCARNGIEYHAIIEHANRSWYYTGGVEGFDPPPPLADVTRPLDSLEIERLAAYSRQQGVGLRVWVHWKPLSEKLEEAFAIYQRWNIQGLMVDFMDRDDQEMVRWQEQVLRTAAKYQIHVQFHGAYKPTGLHRSFPNEFTREGALNLENLKWGSECEPEHNLIIPFTRMLAGATDYHAGGFRALPRETYVPSFHEPSVLGSRCHHLGLYVVLESYLHLVSDYPQAYEGQPGFEFIRQVPSSWDETRVLAAEPGNYAAIARRKGQDWYIGAMNDWTARSLRLPLSFLPAGVVYQGECYRDAEETLADPNHLAEEQRAFRREDLWEVWLAPGGGLAAILRPVK